MNQQEIKAKLERELHTRITAAEWRFLEDVGLLHDLEVGLSEWPEFRRGVKDNLARIRRFRDNDTREQAGEELKDEPPEDDIDRQPPVPIHLDDRTLARSEALDALNNLHSASPGSAAPRPTMTSTLLPRGGLDGTVPGWVWITAVELWMPAEEVAKTFRATQRRLLVNDEQPRTQARAFNVAAFVWRVEAHYGGRPPWPELCKVWNDSPMTQPFKDAFGDDWRTFRRYFKRGEKAVRPHYRASDEQITEQVREASNRGEAVAFDLWASQVLAATVQQGHDAR